jgi:hypothetical protein
VGGQGVANPAADDGGERRPAPDGPALPRLLDSRADGREALADVGDRLDGIIDALDEGLQGAVADAVRDAVALAAQQAVEAVLREVLARPDLLRVVAAQAAPVAEVAEPEPEEGRKEKASGAWSRAIKGLAATLAWLGAAAKRAGRGVTTLAGIAGNALLRGVRRACNGAAALAGLPWRHRRLAALSLALSRRACLLARPDGGRYGGQARHSSRPEALRLPSVTPGRQDGGGMR